jgi:hypothetical protein
MAEREAQLRTALEYNPDGAAGQDPAASGTL